MHRGGDNLKRKVKTHDFRRMEFHSKFKSHKKRGYVYGPPKYFHMISINGHNLFLDRKSINFISNASDMILLYPSNMGINYTSRAQGINITANYGNHMKIFMDYQKTHLHKNLKEKSFRGVCIHCIEFHRADLLKPLIMYNQKGVASFTQET